MTTEEMIDIMRAHTKGLKIEYRAKAGGEWLPAPEPSWSWIDTEYRVQPAIDPRYSPYGDADEMLDDICGRIERDPVLGGIFLRVVDSQKGYTGMITGHCSDGVSVDGMTYKFDVAFRRFVYMDGTPFGKRG